MSTRTPLARAREFLGLGLMPIPVPSCSKNPNRKGWPDERVDQASVAVRFPDLPDACNIGILLGDPSAGAVDIDLDAVEARALAVHFLRPTRTFGRASSPGSHRLYRCLPCVSSAKFAAPADGNGHAKERAMLVELRSNGCQTISPGSIHPSGERVEWENELPIVEIGGPVLASSVARLAAAALLVRAWPEHGARHDAALALAGALLRAEWSADETVRFVQIVCAQAADGEIADRVASVRGTAEKIAAGERTTGLTRLGEIIGARNAAAVGRWLDLSEREEPSLAAYDAYHSAVETPASAWPEPITPAAFRGLVGDIIAAIEPETEADPAALLVQFLVAFGNVIGREPHFIADGARHALNLFAVIVGRTSKGRKGTSWSRIKGLFELAAKEWTSARVVSGLSSGEGLVYQVRDSVVDEEGTITDAGEDDRRLLVVEPEFASVCAVMKRQGNTLSPTVREAWDSGNLGKLTKNSPTRATNAHISIVGHVSRDELRRNLDRTETANGFGNRFLWICAKRSKVLPFGGDDVDLAPLAERLKTAIAYARNARRLNFSQGAAALWASIYPDLSEGRPGLLGAMTARGEAQVARLACIYALLDLRPVIGREHLEAALAVWGYAEASARNIFGDVTGDEVADDVLTLLRASPSGVLRTEIRDYFGRHRSAAIARALTMLLDHGLARRELLPTGGRPAERWYGAPPTPSGNSNGMTPSVVAAFAPVDECDRPEREPVSLRESHRLPCRS
jgi:hypothetical protein